MPLSETVSRIYPLTVAVPAGTPIAAPISVSWVTEDAIVDEIEIQIPTGPNGTTGIRIMKGDIQLIPWGANSWIVGNDYNRVFPVGGYLPTRDIKVQAYNIGQNQHTFYLRMTVRSDTSGTLASSQAVTTPVDLGTPQGSSDPLSPEAILGTDTVLALTSGTLTAADLAPIPPELTPPSVTDTTQPST